jgi:hypothetical protein
MARYEVPRVDTDVHHTWFPHEIAAYFAKPWRDFVAQEPPRVTPPSNMPPNGGRQLKAYEAEFTAGTPDVRSGK